MSSHVVKSLRTLVGARRRQGQRLEEALAEQRRCLAQRQAEAEDARARRDDGRSREQAARDERSRMMNQAFTPAALKALDFAIQDLAAQSAKAGQALVQAQAVVAQQQQAVVSVQAEIRRNDQRIESFDARIAQLLREREQAAEELAEEETEETGAARFSARQRRAREAARHE
jgi:hypothetical protein